MTSGCCSIFKRGQFFAFTATLWEMTVRIKPVLQRNPLVHLKLKFWNEHQQKPSIWKMLFYFTCMKNMDRPISLAGMCFPLALTPNFSVLEIISDLWLSVRKILVLCTNLTEGKNLSLIKCRNFWSYYKDAFSPFCSKFKTCCFSDSAGN